MSMRQLYYTSCVNDISGEAGFHVKAMSKGITDEQIKIIKSLIGYRIPPSLINSPVDTHPIGFRYKRIDKDACLLISSQSNGGDENGRPGNFFAHCVITTPNDFNIFPPIMFWRSPFWKLFDPSNSTIIPGQEYFQEQPTLLINSVWNFLNQGSRRQWFQILLDAVLQYPENKRPIIILDDPDNIALWIMAVSMALPPILRTFISFATYHHNPYQSSFVITGTTNDSAFRFTSEEYISYFILNAFENKISEINRSAYGKLISKYFFEDSYQIKLGDFFKICNRMVPNINSNYQLADIEFIAYYFMAICDNSIEFSDTNAKNGVRFFLNYVKDVSSPNDEELNNLSKVIDHLGKELLDDNQSHPVRDYCTAIQINKQINDSYIDRINLDISLLRNCLLRGKEQVGYQLESTYRVLYPVDEISNVVSQPKFLSELLASMQGIPVQKLTLIWKYLLSYLRHNLPNQSITDEMIRISIKAAAVEAGVDAEYPTTMGKELIKSIVNAFSTDRKACLQAYIQNAQPQWSTEFAWLFYQIVQDLPFEKRKPFRMLLGSQRFNYEIYEIRCEAQNCPPQQITTLLQEWVSDSGWTRSQRSDLLNNAIDEIWSNNDKEKLHIVAEYYLMDRIIFQNLTEQNLSRILDCYFPEFGFLLLARDKHSIFAKSFTYPLLNSNQKAVIGGSFAMSYGSFLPDSPKLINEYLRGLPEEGYRLEVEKLISRFFQNPIELKSHLEMLTSTYVITYEKSFWEIYWKHFKELMLYTSRSSEFVSLLDFWFEQSLLVFNDSPYLGQQFFLQLPDVIQNTSERKEFKQSASMIRMKAQNYRWYRLISEQFEFPKKKSLFGLQIQK